MLRFIGPGFAIAMTLGLAACGSDSSTMTATGPGAGLKCAGGKNAFDTYGLSAFVTVNEAIFTNVTSEVTAHTTTNLGDSFGKIGMGGHDDLATFKGKLAAFLVFVYGGPMSVTYSDGKSYTADADMPAAHAGLEITSAQYDYFVMNVVVPALTTSGVSSADVSSCFAPPLVDMNFKNSIIGK